MKKIIIIITILIVCFCVNTIISGCSGKSTSSATLDEYNEDELPIYINMESIMEKEGVELLSAVASEITYIPLELNSNSLLKEVDFLERLNDNYVVTDGIGIYLFDQNGKYLKTVSQIGQGPSDFYSVIYNMLVDYKANDLYLFSYRKVMKFDSNADYVRQFRIDDVGNRYNDGVFDAGVFTPQNTMILGYGNRVTTYDDTTTVYVAIEVDTVGNIIKKIVNNSPRYARVRGGQIRGYNPLVGVFDDNIRFMDYSNDTIFTVSGNSTIPYAILDLGKNKTTFIIDLDPTRAPTPSDIDEALDKLRGHAIRSVLESSIYLFITITKKGLSGTKYSTYNKKTKELKLLKNDGLLNDLDGGPAFFPKKRIGDAMVGWKAPDEFKEEVLSMDYNEQKAEYGERFEKVYQLAKTIKEDDNPILMIVKK